MSVCKNAASRNQANARATIATTRYTMMRAISSTIREPCEFALAPLGATPTANNGRRRVVVRGEDE
jgi:hypothetical protein